MDPYFQWVLSDLYFQSVLLALSDLLDQVAMVPTFLSALSVQFLQLILYFQCFQSDLLQLFLCFQWVQEAHLNPCFQSDLFDLYLQ